MAQDTASEAPPHPLPTEQGKLAPTAPSAWPETPVPVLAVLFVGVFGVLMASFPARNSELWKYLADGRDLLRGTGRFDASWLYGVVTYAIFSTVGGTGLVAVKALLCGVIAVLMFRLSSTKGGWRIALAVTGLAVLAMGNNRLLLQPATVSVLFLAVALWLLFRNESEPSAHQSGVWPGWRWVVLFAVWANVDARFVLGLGVVALVWFGRLLDTPQPGGRGRALGRWVALVAILVAAACVSPSHVNGLRAPPELQSAVVALRQGVGAESPVNSPFERDYWTLFRESPAALSYYPLLALGLLSFVLNRRAWRWSWFLPWLGLAVASALQIRLAPFFAVVAGPVSAWNLQEYFARRPAPAPLRPWVRYAGLAFTFLLAIAFLVAAWPGWLQGPPFEPRRWTVETRVAIPQGADFLRKTHTNNLWPAGTRTLHVSPDTAGAFAWFDPDDRGLRDESAVELLLKIDDVEKSRARLRELGVNRIVVYAGDSSRASQDMLDRLLIVPDEWPVLHLRGGLVVFGWRDPARAEGPDPYAGWEVDFARLAFRPTESEVAPGGRPPSNPRWWNAFWKPAPPRPPGRAEATVLLRKSSALLQSGPPRHLRAWEVSQVAGLVGAGSGWAGPSGVVDAGLRLNLFRPPIPTQAPLPAFTRLTFALQEKFVFDRGHTPVGIVYAAIRAARRAVAENPNDASSYLALGRAYAMLVSHTSEQSWTIQLPQLMRLRQLQASAALNRAVTLDPKLAPAHLELWQLYLSLKLLDLALQHLDLYRKTPVRWGGPKEGTPGAEAVEKELNRLSKLVERETREFAKEAENAGVSDRALIALRRGLGGQARDLLLKSDVAAFGAVGMELELNLLLQTGRPNDVLEWLTPEVRGSVGEFTYHSLRAQAYIAAGEYDAADVELAEMVGPTGRLPPRAGVGITGWAAKALLDELPGNFFFPQFTWRVLGRPEFEVRVMEITQTMGRSADVLVLRGLVALEAGNIDRAREAFRESLAFSPNRWGGGQLVFNGRSIAWDCLGLIDGPTDFQPARQAP